MLSVYGRGRKSCWSVFVRCVGRSKDNSVKVLRWSDRDYDNDHLLLDRKSRLSFMLLVWVGVCGCVGVGVPPWGYFYSARVFL